MDLIELLSQCICEICSAPGKNVYLSDWMRTRYPAHETITRDVELVEQDARSALLQVPPMAEVLGTALAFFLQDARLTVDWLTHPVLALGNVPPQHLLASLEGQHQVLTLLGRLEFGVLP
ncbi:DUF2384 domain-containing protein [Pseudomonas sp. MOB-449]|nr:DUF2384 domain-containing protein [Pseudomonas sp. MOB-449]